MPVFKEWGGLFMHCCLNSARTLPHNKRCSMRPPIPVCPAGLHPPTRGLGQRPRGGRAGAGRGGGRRDGRRRAYTRIARSWGDGWAVGRREGESRTLLSRWQTQRGPHQESLKVSDLIHIAACRPSSPTHRALPLQHVRQHPRNPAEL